jgi:short subunit fatty acids transporter
MELFLQSLKRMALYLHGHTTFNIHRAVIIILNCLIPSSLLLLLLLLLLVVVVVVVVVENENKKQTLVDKQHKGLWRQN